MFENQIPYWENSGEGSFIFYLISNSFYKVNGVCINDLDNNGTKDIIACSYEGKVIWREKSFVDIIETNSQKIAKVNYLSEANSLAILFFEPVFPDFLVSIYTSPGQRKLEGTFVENPIILSCEQFHSGVYIIKIQFD